jgi:hypothetical protein
MASGCPSPSPRYTALWWWALLNKYMMMMMMMMMMLMSSTLEELFHRYIYLFHLMSKSSLTYSLT